MLYAFLATFVLLLLLVVGLSVFQHKTPRVTAEKFDAILQQVIDGQISTNEWLIFLSVPIRYDPWLEDLRVELLLLDDKYFTRTIKNGQLPQQMYEPKVIALITEIKDKVFKQPYKDF